MKIDTKIKKVVNSYVFHQGSYTVEIQEMHTGQWYVRKTNRVSGEVGQNVEMGCDRQIAEFKKAAEESCKPVQNP